jgi:hypothetical protein
VIGRIIGTRELQARWSYAELTGRFAGFGERTGSVRGPGTMHLTAGARCVPTFPALSIHRSRVGRLRGFCHIHVRHAETLAPASHSSRA